MKVYFWIRWFAAQMTIGMVAYWILKLFRVLK